MFPDFLEDSADVVAQRLLGCTFTRTITYADEKHTLVARIVETEAYDESDPASHAFGGKTKRNAAMYGPAGHLYVYLSYGMHFCCNVVCSKDGYGSGVLIRAVEPISGIETMLALRESGKTRKHPLRDYDLTNGPGKVCAALSIARTLYGHNLRKYWYQQKRQCSEKIFYRGEPLCIKVVPLASSTHPEPSWHQRPSRSLRY